MPKRAPFIQFRVCAGATDGRGLYALVNVWDTRAALLADLRAAEFTYGDSKEPPADIEGMFQGSKRYLVGGKLTPCIGLVSLHRARLGTEVITHEFSHAAFAYISRLGLTDKLYDMANEEQFCYALGRMASRFVRRAIKLGLYPE